MSLSRGTVGHLRYPLPGGLSSMNPRGYGLVGARVTSATIDRWNKLLLDSRVSPTPAVIQPDEFLALLTRDLTVPHALRFAFSGSSFHFVLVVHDGKHPIALASRSVWPEQHRARHHLVHCLRPRSGVGSYILLRNAISLYDRIGVQWIEITAGLTAGSAVWPRRGFIPATPQVWMGLSTRLLGRFERLEGNAPHPLGVEIRRILSDHNPKAIWELADLSDRSLAKDLLQGLRWEATLDLSDSKSRLRALHLPN
jgi:hypothetical protein